MGLELKFEQALTPKITHEQRLELRQGISTRIELRLSQLIDSWNEQSSTSPGDVIKESYVASFESLIKLLSTSSQEVIEEVNARLSPDSQIGRVILGALVENTADVVCGNTSLALIEPLYRNGVFTIDTDNIGIPEIKAALRPGGGEKIDKSIAELERLLSGGVKEKALDGIRRELALLKIKQQAVNSILPLTENIKKYIDLIMRTPVDGEALLYHSLIDSIVYEHIITPRHAPQKVLKQLSTAVGPYSTNNFIRKAKNGEDVRVPEGLRYALGNAIGKLVLVSMGVIDPDIYTLQKGRVDPSLKKDIRAATGQDIDNILDRYNLGKGPQFFFNRYHTKKQPPSRVADNAIRDFITTTVRADLDQYITALNLEEEYNKYLSSLIDMDNEYDHEDKQAASLEFVASLFDSEKLAAEIKRNLPKYILSINSM